MARVLPPVGNQQPKQTDNVQHNQSTQALHNPVVMHGASEINEHDTYESPDRVLRSHGDASQSLDKLIFDKVTEHPYDAEKMAMLAFMNEDIEVRMGVNNDPNAEQIFEITINGRIELFRRGQTKTVKRYFVDHMMRLKETRWSYAEVVNSQGEKDMLYTPHTAIKYDFAITRDDNPLSKSWQRAVMAEAG